MTSIGLGQIGNSFKYVTLGLATGLVMGTITERVSDEVINLLDLKDPQSHGLAENFAILITRGTIASLGLLFAAELQQSFTIDNDPTSGTYFVFAFMTAQSGLWDQMKRVQQQLNGVLPAMRAPPSAGSCCSDCSEGKSCSGGKH